MIHFTCDGCERRIDTASETRFVFRLEIYAAPDDAADLDGSPCDEPLLVDADRDHLTELEDLLESPHSFDDDADDPAQQYRQVRYDLCSECRERVLRNPLGRLALGKVDFSEN